MGNESASIQKISSIPEILTVKDLHNILSKLIEEGKQDYPISLCGTYDYYIYIISTKNKKLISLDTDIGQFQGYFNND